MIREETLLLFYLDSESEFARGWNEAITYLLNHAPRVKNETDKSKENEKT